MLKPALALTTLLALGACGLRGDLERPEPLFGEATAEDAEAELPTNENVFKDDPTDDQGPRFNEYGGIIPDASPSDPVEEEGLGAPGASDEDAE